MQSLQKAKNMIHGRTGKWRQNAIQANFWFSKSTKLSSENKPEARYFLVLSREENIGHGLFLGLHLHFFKLCRLKK